MFKNYFTIAFRTLWKNRLFSAINILGLAIGISASLVIYLLVNYHFSFDKFEADNNRIYRVVSNFSFSGEVYHNSGVTDPLAPAVSKEVTGIETVAPFRRWDNDIKISVPVAGNNEPKFFKHQNDIIFANSNYFDLIHYQWLAGSQKTALNNPYQTVLTTTAASLYYPNVKAADLIGKTLYFNDTISATIAGVVRDLNANTDFTFTTFIAYATLEKTSLKPQSWENWSSTNGAQQLFVKLAEGTNPKTIEKKIAQLFKKYETKEPGDKSLSWHTLQPLSDLHFNADYGTYGLPVANRPTLYGLLAVALFLMILGCINFINLTTAHASQRAKEIGVRKTMGSSKRQLVVQFLSETFMLTFLATLVSVALTPLIIKAFADFIPAKLNYSLIEQPNIILFLIGLMLVVSLLSGFYPSMVLSSYKPVLVLKNQSFSNAGKTRAALLRRSLTVFQFVIAQVFIMATLLVSKQIHYSLNKDMGFKKDAIIYFWTNFYDTSQSNKYVLLDKIKSIPEVKMVSLATNPPSSNSTWSGTIKYKDGKKEVDADVQQKYGDSNYIKLYNIKLIAGNNITTTDTVTSILINETFAHTLGFQNVADAVGKSIEWSNKQIPISGVVADFMQSSLYEPIKPLMIGSWSTNQRNFNIALQPQNKDANTWKNAISKIEKAFKEVYPKDDFDYQFFDEDIAKYYAADQHISSLLKWATGLAVFISCLGLLGLVIYTTTQRTKEIGVRKVLGASVAQIVSLISKDFILLVLLAFIIAAPLAWFGMHQWLQNFAYRTSISWWIFLLSAAVMLVIALLTLGFQTIRAAVANPVKSLRTE